MERRIRVEIEINPDESGGVFVEYKLYPDIQIIAVTPHDLVLKIPEATFKQIVREVSDGWTE